MAQIEYDCTVHDLQAITPCVKCLSRRELLAVMVVIMADLVGYDLPDDNNELLEDSACFNCLSDRELLNGFVSTMIAQSREGWSIEQLRNEIKCVLCWDEHRLKATLALLFCETVGFTPN